MDDRILHHEYIRGEAPPGRWLLMLHGIYGSGRNWATIARQVVQQRPDWGVVLVDLRGHGGSVGFDPPHTLHAVAEDVKRLMERLSLGEHAVLGHSFGGKVALTYARSPAPGLLQVWVIDSTPAVREPAGQAWDVLRVLQRIPSRFASREEAIARLRERGLPAGLASWLAMNLTRDAAGELVWRIDPGDMEQMLADFAAADLWDVVEREGGATDLHFVRATRSDLLTDAVAGRIAQAATLHTVEGGHWINVDNPQAMVSLLASRLPR